ncbi:hypothetical protein DFR81_11111 [Garciella nitratireducens]|nr:DAK2 domain-containing protein [Garciella nitratireducens]RBP41115.1 hypothetical protein DFR81_11111 [Garciella nitratireducens]
MEIKYIDGPLLKKMIFFAAQNLENNKEFVNNLNVFPVPDGDTGTNMALTIQFAVKEISNINTNELSKIIDTGANGSLMGARGNSGVILSQLFRGFAKECKNKEILKLKDFAQALQSGTDMAYKAVMKPTEGTILTITREVSKFAVENVEKFQSLETFLEKIIEYGNKVLSETPNMLSVLKEAGVVDAGGKGFMYILEGAYKAFFEENFKESERFSYSIINEFKKKNSKTNSSSNIKFGYCTEFMIIAKKVSTDIIKSYLSKMGDSLLVVGDDNKIKVHIHTNHPGKVIEYALQIGELINIKIDNMREQHRNQFDFKEERMRSIEEKNYGFITVATGKRIIEIFKDLGVDSIIQGGQTMNPSTEDFIKEINKIHAKHIYILPNNSNIFMAANQAKEISNKNVYIIPTKTIPQGISALLAFNPENNSIDNYKNMKDTIKKVKTGQVTFAVRDTQVNNLKINKNDIIGIYDGNIITVGKDINEVAIQLIQEMLEDDDELITIFTGEGVSKKHREFIQEKIEDHFSQLDIEIHEGGQPLYYYIISVE